MTNEIEIEKPKEVKEIEIKKEPKAKVVLSNKTIQIGNLEEIYRLSNLFCNANLVPSSLKATSKEETTARVTTVLLAGYEAGLGITEALSSYYIVNNRPCMYGDALKSQLFKSKDFKKFTEEWEENSVVMTAYRPSLETTFTASFSQEDAEKAGLWNSKDVWKKYPLRMLKARCFTLLARDGWADYLAGTGIVEEQDDIVFHNQDDQKIKEVMSSEVRKDIDFSELEQLKGEL
jgi:hypothetical protein